jgi:UDP-GlcNAc:undecaprenyl-phosphate GlcNAc-1-phosphate transferase
MGVVSVKYVFLEILLIVLLTFFSYKTKILLEFPSERKKHRKPVPLIGGIVLFLTILMSSSAGLMKKNFGSDILFYLVFAIGLVDDMFEIPYYAKLVLQFVAGLTYVNLHTLRLTGISNFDTLISLAFFIVILNGFNLIDGINGLLLGVALIYSIMALNLQFAIFIFVLALFNFKEILFMGDSGAFLIAYVLLVSSQNVSNELTELAVFFGYPLYEITSSFLRRVIFGKNPFKPDRFHLHYIGSEVLGTVFFLINAYLLTLGFSLLSTKKFGLVFYLLIWLTLFFFQIVTIKHSERMLERNQSDFEL